MPQDEMLGLRVEVAERLTDYRKELAKVRSEVAQLRTRIVILERLANEVLRQRLPRAKPGADDETVAGLIDAWIAARSSSV
jgi:uncharacterized protein (DUF342 family)